MSLDGRLNVQVIGAGLAGAEAAWQIAERGVDVILYEMRPTKMTPAHQTDRFAELVCSNSLGAALPDRALGLLKEELRRLGSLIMACADATRVPAGGALAVDREAFAELVTRRVSTHPRITILREEVTEIPQQGIVVIATGPLTSEAFAGALARLTGSDALYFYDAMAPIVTLESINMERAFCSSRYARGEADYINCPLTKDEYERFVAALIAAEQIPLRSFEREDPRFFEACLPIEVMARRNPQTLAYGPLKPVGLTDPRTGQRPYAVAQLRQDNLAGTLYNMVGFQTNLRWSEQERVFRMIPGLERAEFVRFGQMHRNTFLDSPRLLAATMQMRCEKRLFFAGQITGTEGYVGSTASGYVAGVNASRLARRLPLIVFPGTTMIGALTQYVSSAQPDEFQPMKANFGILPPLEETPRSKRQRATGYMERALRDLSNLSDIS